MIRSSKHILKYSNKDKLEFLESLYSDYQIALQECINLILSGNLELKVLLNSKDIPVLGNISHSQWKQVIYKQASEIIRSTTKKNKELRFKHYKKVYRYFKEKNRQIEFLSKKWSELNLKYKKFIVPEPKNISIFLDERLFDVQFGDSFDEFIQIKLPYFKKKKTRDVSITLNLPVKYHKNSLKYSDWKRKNTICLSKVNSNFYLTFFYEIPEPNIKSSGSELGIDIGYKKLLSTSRKEFLGLEIENLCTKISKKLRCSKNYNQSLTERTNYINQVCNSLDLTKVNYLVLENLKNLKHKSKLNTKFLNKLQYWIYPKVISKLESLCSEQGIYLEKVSPRYTSQTCSECGCTDKESRNLESFICTSCGTVLDADYNASLNILHRGIYSSSQEKLQI